jgi:hypothetical protein
LAIFDTPDADEADAKLSELTLAADCANREARALSDDIVVTLFKLRLATDSEDWDDRSIREEIELADC